MAKNYFESSPISKVWRERERDKLSNTFVVNKFGLNSFKEREREFEKRNDAIKH